MKKSKNKDFDDSLLYTQEIIDPLFSHKVMSQKINKKVDIILSDEIIKKKKFIYELFQQKFGPNFIEKKPDSLNHFEHVFGRYLFSKKSLFLKKYFPSLYHKLFHEKKIDLEKLKAKINIGSMMYLTLRKHLVSNKSLINDKLLYISKNFSTKTEKDLVSNLYLKFKKNGKKKGKVYFHSSAKSLNVGSISKLNSNESRLKSEKNLLNHKISIDSEKYKKQKYLTLYSDNDNDNNKSNKKEKYIVKRNKKIVQFNSCFNNNSKIIKKKSSKMLNKHPSYEMNHNKYNNLYLSNPFYLYNLNIYNRNKIKKKNNITEKSSITEDNYITLQDLITNIQLKNSSLKQLNNENDTFFNSYVNSPSPSLKYNTTYSSNFKGIKNKAINNNLDSKSNSKSINIIRIKNDKEINENEIIKKEENDKNTENENEIIKKEKRKRDKNKENEKENENVKKSTIKIRNIKNLLTLNEKKWSFEKKLRNKSRKFKTRINSEAKILNNCTDKCNKKLIKIIDGNFILSSKEKQKNKNKNINFDITKLLLDDKIPKKVFKKHARENNTMKPIIRKTIKDLTKFDKSNKNLGKNYFIKNINNMPTDLALFFIGKLYPTKHIKFELKEYTQKRKELKLIENEYKVKKARERAKFNLFKMKQLEYSLSNEKDAYFNGDKNKIIY